jgi:hypothetical protein
MSGRIKVLVGKTKKVVNILSIRASTIGDPEYWRAKLEEQKRENNGRLDMETEENKVEIGGDC